MTGIVRVFPRRTAGTPTDALAFVGDPPLMLPAPVSEIHVSVAFTWDRAEGERLARAWECHGLPVKIGGPAYMEPSGEFIPGRYLRPGYVITSRGCPNACWFCSAWRREPALRELPIKDGWILQDDNLLACAEDHIRAVFAMLGRQPERAVFSGGLEAARLEWWHVDLLAGLRSPRLYFAYDTPDDLDQLVKAGVMLRSAGFNPAGHRLRCYVLIGQPRDTFSAAERRIGQVIAAGFFPFAMLWRGEDGRTTSEWRRFQRQYANPTIAGANNAKGEHEG